MFVRLENNMEEPILFLETSYPARTIGYLIKKVLGLGEYITVKKCLEDNNSAYMLDVLCDAMFVSETSFFSSLRRRALRDLLYDIETTTPSIYYLLYTRLSEKEIQEHFSESGAVLTDRCFLIPDAKKLMSRTSKDEFLDLAKCLVNTGSYQYFNDSKIERSKAWEKEYIDDLEQYQRRLYVQYG